MPEQAQHHNGGVFTRIGGWFRRGGQQGQQNPDAVFITHDSDLNDTGSVDEQPGEHAGSSSPAESHGHPHDPIPAAVQSLVGQPHLVRSTFLRPWAKRDAAIENLQNGVAALGDLMNSIRDNLERTSHRQDELLQYLSHLPNALQQLPEQNRLQSEALRAIERRMAQQSGEQSKLAEILDRISQADAQHGRALDALQDRVETLNGHDQKIAENLNEVGEALESVSRNSEATSIVLQQMRDNLNARDGELERILQRQGTRFTTMLAVAIFLAIGAMSAVGVVGYLMLTQAR